MAEFFVFLAVLELVVISISKHPQCTLAYDGPYRGHLALGSGPGDQAEALAPCPTPSPCGRGGSATPRWRSRTALWWRARALPVWAGAVPPPRGLPPVPHRRVRVRRPRANPIDSTLPERMPPRPCRCP